MMERLREGANSLTVKIILSLIIFSFVFAGVGGYLTDGSKSPIVKIGDQNISHNQFEQAYKNEHAQMQTQAGDVFTTLLSDPDYLAQFRSDVLNRMVNKVLLDQQADALGLRVSDEQIKQTIRSMPAFHATVNNFDNDFYLATLKHNHLTPDQFAKYVRQDLVREQLIHGLQNSAFVLKNELTSLYKLERQTRSVRTLSLSPDDFAAKAHITAEQEQDYYQQNPAKFIRPKQFKISYVELSGDSIANLMNVTERDAKEYYDANLALYSTLEKRKVSHIMIQGDDNTAKIKAEVVLAELNAGADFAELARMRSYDTFSAKQGGQLDWFETGVMDFAFEEAAFSLVKKGDISGVVKSSFGYHIIKLNDIKASGTEPFETVRDQIIVQLKQQYAADKFFALSNDLTEKAFEMPDNLDEAASAINSTVQQTDFISLSDLNGTLAHPKVQKALQLSEKHDDGLNSDIIELSPEHIIVVRIDDTQPELVLSFDDAQPQVISLLKRQIGEKEVHALAKNLVDELRVGNNTNLNALGYVFSDATDVGRMSSDREVVELAFTLPAPTGDTSEYGITRSLNGNLIIVALDSVKEPKATDISLASQMANRISHAFASSELMATINQLKQNTKITYPLKTTEQYL
ncbi:peptidylprolyl isomerase [Candidatus Enterovibrio altilux]|uniref:Periplasmic chaperone PpiD n=1 Tax=Candidatus Enterovibrio altilux TaxID=1927128 RepID=A0A291B7T5_9GAMM|nr:peptidylprolyl isomerase [Candidatus Enterovibrio luxaltus]ATF09053.1 Peptidyl-prolyl cis-trans isomerase PpiD [Candidatus Enterovibrio luxaltus]